MSVCRSVPRSVSLAFLLYFIFVISQIMQGAFYMHWSSKEGIAFLSLFPFFPIYFSIFTLSGALFVRVTRDQNSRHHQ